jgi:transposase
VKLRADVEVFVAVQPIDLRWSFDRLAGCVTERIGRNPKGGALFVFFGRRSPDRVKILFYDRGGYCLFYRRLDRGTFRRPLVRSDDATSVSIDARELDALLEGLDLPDEKKPPLH